MQITIQIRSHMIRFIIRIYERHYFFFYWINDIYKTPFKVVEKVGNPPLCSGVIAVPSGPKSHTLTVILAVFASQPRCCHKPWKSLFLVYSPHLWSRKLFKCRVPNWLQSFQAFCLLADLPPILPCQSSPSRMNTHYYRVALPTPKRQESWDSRPRAGKSFENIKKVVRFAKFPSGWPTAHDNFATV